MGVNAHHQRRHRHPGLGRRASGARTRHRRHHHRSSLPEAELPPALAVLNPNRRDCTISRQKPMWRGRSVQAGAGAARDLGMAGRKAGPGLEVVPEVGGHRDRGRRGAAGRRKPHHREAWPRKPAPSQEPRTARDSGTFRVAQRPRPQRTPGGFSNCPAHQRRRAAWTTHRTLSICF